MSNNTKHSISHLTGITLSIIVGLGVPHVSRVQLLLVPFLVFFFAIFKINVVNSIIT